MSKNQNVAFRSSLGGYNRDDVNQYILRTDRAHEEDLAALRATLEEAQRSGEAAAAAQAAAEADAAAARQALGEAEAVLAAQREASEAEHEELLRLREEAEAAARREEENKTRLAQLEDVIASYNRDGENEEAEKSQKYDEISAQVGDILIRANTSAERILSAANRKAARIVAETDEEEKYVRSRLSELTDEMLTQLSGEMHDASAQCLRELLAVLTDMRDSADGMIQHFTEQNHTLTERIEEFRDDVHSSVAGMLSEMDDKYGTIRSEGKTPS